MKSIIQKFLFSLLALYATQGILHADLVAEYRFDACSWDGTAGEVKDSSGNDHNGTIKLGVSSSTIGEINQGGNFSNNYIELPDFPHLNNSRTITAWFKTTDKTKSGQRIFADDENDNAGSYALSLGDPGAGKIRFYIRGLSSVSLDSPSVIENDTWYFVAATFDSASMQKKLYIYNQSGTLLSEVSGTVSGTIGTPTGMVSIGGETDNGETGNRFQGYIDEVKVFNVSLSDNQVQTIFDNEKSGNNYDGTPRTPPCCCLPQNGNLIANPGFEITCNSNIVQTWTGVEGGTVHLRDGLCGWSVFDSIETWEDTTQKPASEGGVFTEIDGNSGTRDGIYQLLDTVADENYTIQFDYKKRDTDHNDTIIVKWNDTEVAQVEGDVNSWQTGTIYVTGTTGKDKLSFEEPNAADDGYGSWIDNIRVIVGGAPLPQASYFDVWDITGNINDRNISTKIAAQPFNLTLAALDEANNGYQDFNGTVCTQVVDAGHGNIPRSRWVKRLFTETNSTTVTFNIPTAIQNARVKIAWKRNIDTGCPLTDEDNSTLSSDNFAVRPQKFIFQNIPTGKLTAEHGYTFKAVAVNADGTTATPDYNTTLSPVPHKYFRDGSDGSAMDGTFTPATNFSFADGATPDTTLSFDNVGIVGLELNDTTWAAVDSDDTPLANRTIYVEQNLTFIPDHFKVEFPNTPAIQNKYADFTYLSNDLNMSATLTNLDIKITAEGEKNSTMTNYQSPQNQWFANNVNVTPDLTIPRTPNSQNIPESVLNQDLNFTSGVANYSFEEVAFNYDRNRSKPVNPLTIEGSDTNFSVSVTDQTDTEVEGNKTVHFDGNATFYYGRLRAEDIKTSQTTSKTNIHVQVYSTSQLPGFDRESISWYLNKKDSFTVDGNRSEEKRKLTATTVTDNTMSGGSHDITITANPADKSYRKFYHLKIPAWLWYSNYEDYNFTTGSTCAQHPCFTYIFDSPLEDHGIASGDFKGAAFDNNFTSAPKRKAVKLLR